MSAEYMLVDRQGGIAYALGKGRWLQLPLGPAPPAGWPRDVLEVESDAWLARVRAIGAGTTDAAHLDTMAFETYLFCARTRWDVALWSDAVAYPPGWYDAQLRRVYPIEIRTRYVGAASRVARCAEAFERWMAAR